MITRSIGAWTVAVSPDLATAFRGTESLTYSTSVTRFPIGYRVGHVWSPEAPPKSVLALANTLANTLTGKA